MNDLTRLLQTLQPTPDGESAVRHRTALVDAVNADGTVDLDFDGTIIPDVSVLQGAAVAAGATVQVVAWAGDLLVLGSVAGYQTAYVFGGSLYFTVSDTFDKATYPGLRAVRVKCQGGGGGGGSAAATGANQASIGAGGGGGGYAETWVLVSALAASETVTVGAGGAGGTTGPGANGGATSFGAHCVGNGGAGGSRHSAVPPPNAGAGVSGGSGTGDLVIPGSGTEAVHLASIAYVFGPKGGDSHLGAGAAGLVSATGSGGGAGRRYGGGGSGGVNRQSQGTSKNGGDGAEGIVIVDLYF